MRQTCNSRDDLCRLWPDGACAAAAAVRNRRTRQWFDTRIRERVHGSAAHVHADDHKDLVTLSRDFSYQFGAPHANCAARFSDVDELTSYCGVAFHRDRNDVTRPDLVKRGGS